MRDKSNPRVVTTDRVPGTEWVFDGEGTATRKYDGTCAAVIDGRLYKRLSISSSNIASRGLPDDYIEAQHVEGSGEHFGWVPVGSGPEDWMFRKAVETHGLPGDGTYELVGPKVQKNPDGYEDYVLVRHGAFVLEDVPRTFDGLRDYLRDRDIEGIVWHHSDGRMAKIKGRDFGHRRAKRETVVGGATPKERAT